MTATDALYQHAAGVMPGGTSRLHYYYPPHPIYAASGRGCRLTDVDGVERIDCLNNMTSLIHGHADPDINAAIIDQLQRGTAWSEPGEAEWRLAQLMVDRVASVERIRFANSGTEAVMMAIKLAREFTGRSVLAKFEGHYHGYYDYVQVSVATPPDRWGPDDAPATVPVSGGLAESVVGEVLVLPWNRPEAVEALLAKHGHRIAALILDPLSNRCGMAPPAAGFMEFLTEITRRHGIVLIYDEVISFRMGHGGAQARYGGTPDLTTFGKIMGGGLPVGAVGGRAEIMSLLDPTGGKPRLESGGTFSGNPLTMVAGLAAMQKYTEAEVARLHAMGDDLRRRVDQVFAQAGEVAQLAGDGSLFRVLLTRDVVTDYRSSVRNAQPMARMGELHKRLLHEGVIISRIGLGCLSTPMVTGDIDQIVAAFERAVAR
ncbi:MAG: aspartate aminotransferase family protein [Gemmatimonadetes bacterium]|nr:aspartate aminotransferase family protein [Gemmatimonadota bacterium]